MGCGASRRNRTNRSAPASLDKHVALRPLFPTWLDPHGMFVGRTLPMAFNPNMAPFTPHVVTLDPNMIVRGALAFDDHFVPRWWRRLGHKVQADMNGRRHLRLHGNPLLHDGGTCPPATGDKNIAVAVMLPARFNPHMAWVRRQFPVSGQPDMPATPPFPITADPDMRGRRRRDNDLFPWWRRGRQLDHGSFDNRRRRWRRSLHINGAVDVSPLLDDTPAQGHQAERKENKPEDCCLRY